MTPVTETAFLPRRIPTVIRPIAARRHAPTAMNEIMIATVMGETLGNWVGLIAAPPARCGEGT